MFYHILLTDDCNLCCRYCRGKSFENHGTCEGPEIKIDEDLPADLDVDLNEVYEFLSMDPGAVLTFYGGEPLMRPDLVRRIVTEAPVSRFMIQTNGLLLNQVEPHVINTLETILVSLDGPEQVTDRNRGAGTFRKVMDNLRAVRENGYTGELIARITVDEGNDIFESVTYLADNEEFPFSSIHWQIDANFWSDFDARNFEAWVEESYNPGITRLVDSWLTRIRDTGKVPRWYPFLDPVEDLLYGRASRLRCGAGYANYSIMTDGSIAACPVMVGMKEYYLGHICHSDPLMLPTLPIGGRCIDCEILAFCGGRCLYSNLTRPWTDEQADILCSTIRHLYRRLTAAMPEIAGMLERGRIVPEDLSHTKYNGCEIIP